jgi:hypothetical protein
VGRGPADADACSQSERWFRNRSRPENRAPPWCQYWCQLVIESGRNWSNLVEVISLNPRTLKNPSWKSTVQNNEAYFVAVLTTPLACHSSMGVGEKPQEFTLNLKPSDLCSLMS